MTPLEKLAETIRTKRLFASHDELARIVAECLFPAKPEPERIEAMAKGVRRNQFVRTRRTVFDESVPPTENELDDARAAHAAARTWIGL